MLAERFPAFVALVEELPARVGRGTVRETLQEVATNALAYYGEIVPMAASIFSEPGSWPATGRLFARGAGPWMINETLASYLDAEERLGRVRKDAMSKPRRPWFSGRATSGRSSGVISGRTCPRKRKRAL